MLESFNVQKIIFGIWSVWKFQYSIWIIKNFNVQKLACLIKISVFGSSNIPKLESEIWKFQYSKYTSVPEFEQSKIQTLKQTSKYQTRIFRYSDVRTFRSLGSWGSEKTHSWAFKYSRICTRNSQNIQKIANYLNVSRLERSNISGDSR